MFILFIMSITLTINDIPDYLKDSESDDSFEVLKN